MGIIYNLAQTIYNASVGVTVAGIAINILFALLSYAGVNGYSYVPPSVASAIHSMTLITFVTGLVSNPLFNIALNAGSAVAVMATIMNLNSQLQQVINTGSVVVAVTLMFANFDWFLGWLGFMASGTVIAPLVMYLVTTLEMIVVPIESLYIMMLLGYVSTSI